MNMPTPTKKNEKVVSKRSTAADRLSAEDLVKWMKHQGIDEHELSEIFGVTIQAVKLWVSGDREFSVTNSRLVAMFKKYPQLLKEF